MSPSKSIVVIGAILGCWMLLVVASSNKKAVAKLNAFLVKEAGPENNDLAANAAKAEAKYNSRCGLLDGDLKVALGAFLEVARAKSCTLELANAIGYLLVEPETYSRVNRLVIEEFWTVEMREQCLDSLGDLASELLSRMPRDDKMQTYLSHCQYLPRDPKLPYKAPTSYSFANAFRNGNLKLVQELVEIAEEQSIVLVENKLNEATGKVERKKYAQRYRDLVKNYYVKPCEIHTYLSSSFTRFVELLIGDLSDKKFNDLTAEVRNIYYRVHSCKLYKEFDEKSRKRYKYGILALYSVKHPPAMVTVKEMNRLENRTSCV